jgi:fructose-bisphosphate aldolase class 1
MMTSVYVENLAELHKMLNAVGVQNSLLVSGKSARKFAVNAIANITIHEGKTGIKPDHITGGKSNFDHRVVPFERA